MPLILLNIIVIIGWLITSGAGIWIDVKYGIAYSGLLLIMITLYMARLGGFK